MKNKLSFSELTPPRHRGLFAKFRSLRFMLVMLMAFLGVNVAFGETVTYTLTSTSCLPSGDVYSGSTTNVIGKGTATITDADGNNALTLYAAIYDNKKSRKIARASDKGLKFDRPGAIYFTLPKNASGIKIKVNQGGKFGPAKSGDTYENLSDASYDDLLNVNSTLLTLSSNTEATYNSASLSAGTLYKIVSSQALSGSSSWGLVTLTITYEDDPVAPSITTQPTGASYEQNATASALKVVASGTPTPTYQWYSNATNSNEGGALILDATSAEYTPSTATVGTTYYYCVATNEKGSATSNVAAVAVTAPVAKYTVRYMDGTTEMGTEEVNVGEVPTAAGIVTTKAHYTFTGWTPALDAVSGAEGETVTVNAGYTAQYAATVDFMANVFATRSTKTLAKFFEDGSHNYTCGGTFSSSQWGTTGEDAAYQGYKFKDKSVWVEFLVPAGKTVVMTFGNYGAKANIKRGSAAAVDMTLTNSEYRFTTTEDEVVRFTTNSGSANTVTLKSIKIGTPVTVTFMNGADVFDTKSVMAGETVSAPATNPEKTGYNFIEWRKAGAKYDFATAVTEALTLDAYFEEITTSITVTYNANGGTCATPSATYTGADALVLPAAEFTGKLFDGWYDAEDNLIGKAGAEYTPTADIELFAHYSYEKILRKAVFSNSFEAWIDENAKTATVFYLEGETAPTYVEGVASTGCTISMSEGKLIVKDADEATVEYVLTMTAVTPATVPVAKITPTTEAEAEVSWIKNNYGWASDKGWKFAKTGDAADWSRRSNGNNHVYLFVGACENVKLTWKVNRAVKVYRNGTEVTATTADGILTIPGDINNASMIKIASNQNSGDGGFSAVEVLAHVVSTDATLKTLKYGETPITLVAEQFTYSVELPWNTAAVPALAAEVNDANATTAITDATAFVEKAATSTVVVTAEDGVTTKTYTVNFTVAAHHVAKIGEVYYESLQDAVNAAPAGVETLIEIVADNENGGVKVPADKNIIIDFGGFTYNATPTVGSAGTETNGFQLLKGATVTLQNGTLTSTTAKILIQNYANLTIAENMVIDASANAACGYAMSNNCGEVVIAGTVIAAEGKTAFDVCVAQSKGYEMVSVTIKETAHITGAIEYDVWGTLPAEVNSTLTVEGGEFTNCAWNVEAQLAEAAKENLNVKGGTFDVPVPADYCAEGYAPAELGGGKYGVKVVHTFDAWDGTSVNFTKAGEWTMYSSYNSGKELAENQTTPETTFKKNQQIEYNKDASKAAKANVNYAQYVTVVFAKDMKTVQLLAYNSSSRTLNNIYTLDVEGKKLTDVTSKYTKNSAQNSTTKVSTMDATGHFEAGVYYVFKVSSSCNIFDFFATASVEDVDKTEIIKVTVAGEELSAADLATLKETKTLTLANKAAAEMAVVYTTQRTISYVDETYVKEFDPQTVNATMTLSEGYYTATTEVLGENYTIKAQEMVAVAMIGATGYETLAEAVAAANAGDEIVLLTDVEENIVVPADKNIVLNLGGFALNGKQAANTATVKNLGTLTIKNGTVKRMGEGSAVNYYVIENEGTITLNCSVEGNGQSSLIRNNATAAKMTITDGNYTQTGAFIVVKNDLGEVIINGGTFTTTADKAVLNNWDQMTINGGTFTGLILNGAYDTDNNKLIINDGIFNTDKIRTYTGNGMTSAPIEIYGGEFTSTNMLYTAEGTATASQASVAGGTFKIEVPAEVCAPGFEPKDNGDGTYGVKVMEAILPINGSTTWRWADIADQAEDVQAQFTDINLATRITPTEQFQSQSLKATGDRTVRLENGHYYAQVTNITFETTVPGFVAISMRSTGSGKTITATIQGTEAGSTTNTFKTLDPVFVNAGEVSIDITGASMGRVELIEFTAADADYTRDVVAGNYSGFCIDKAVAANMFVGAEFYTTDYKTGSGSAVTSLTLREVDHLEAGVGYICLATANKIYMATNGESQPAATEGTIIGAYERTLVPENQGMFVVLSNKLYECGTNCHIKAGSAYINMGEVSETPSQAPGRRRVVGSTNATTGLENIELTEDMQKLLINGELFIIRGGKMFNAAGLLVK